jgi:hypothetical protein
MSHFTRIQTKIVEKEQLLQAIRDLGFSYEEGEVKLSGFGFQQTQVDIAIRLPFSYDIGFRKNGEFYEIVTDWFGVRGVKQEEFTSKITQRYAYHVTRVKLENQGFTLVEEQVQETGEIRLLLRRMN